MTEQEQGSKLWAGIVVITAIVGLVGLHFMGAGVDREHSTEWCEDQNGSVYNSYAVAHGGFHCELPNGTVEHIHVAERMNGATNE